ncbi:MAG TPA: L,D-transpeptidase [Marmoricola sp.]|nr:L,D-transpeptidase [Marmoricola sp.]
MSRHRSRPPSPVRLRPGRVLAALASVAVTGVTLLGGLGVLPLQQGTAYADEARARGGATTTGPGTSRRPALPARTTGTGVVPPATEPGAGATQLPAGTGAGRRVVFDISAQRVWLVDAADRMVRTYLVSGSLTDNLRPGDYRVYSRSRWAVGVDDSGVMQYFVRFAHGRHAAIGFHSIPTKNGHPLQTVAQLGTPQSHGCIRQRLADARRMWRFAPVGTEVRVVA